MMRHARSKQRKDVEHVYVSIIFCNFMLDHAVKKPAVFHIAEKFVSITGIFIIFSLSLNPKKLIKCFRQIELQQQQMDDRRRTMINEKYRNSTSAVSSNRNDDD